MCPVASRESRWYILGEFAGVIPRQKDGGAGSIRMSASSKTAREPFL